MTSVTAPIRLTPRMVVAAWRGITRGELRTTFLLGCLLLLYYLVVTMLPLERSFQSYFVWFITAEIHAFALLLAIVVADRATGKDPDRRGAYVLAVVVGAATGHAVASLASITLGHLGVGDEYAPGPGIGIALYIVIELVMLGVATVWIVNDRRRARVTRDRMHSAELARTDATRRTIESELQAMQARVEPQFLFNTLAQVKRLYEQDAGLGERMLAELITYLRAAMPKMRDTSSTVGQEIDLVRASLAIVKVRLGDRLTYEIELPAALADVRMPPMLLLPLIDHVIVHGLEPATGAGSIRIRIGASNGRLLLTVTDSGAGFAPETRGGGIASIRERLAALYPTGAGLVLRSIEMGASEAVMEIPLERVAGDNQPPAA